MFIFHAQTADFSKIDKYRLVLVSSIIFNRKYFCCWLEQDTSCPTRWMSLNAGEGRVEAREAREAAAGPGVATQPHINHFFLFDGETLKYISLKLLSSVPLLLRYLLYRDIKGL